MRVLCTNTQGDRCLLPAGFMRAGGFCSVCFLYGIADAGKVF
ncbi:unnamed protein product [Acetobacter orientalis]|uniref:Unnamed protein product n=1 Tax=Acetobacter orientalis TaxID=146474 RepID=A0A2Z5ZH02_9PROT|nr:unnamed protein product [Acetobacter orientalis]